MLDTIHCSYFVSEPCSHMVIMIKILVSESTSKKNVGSNASSNSINEGGNNQARQVSAVSIN